MGTSPQRKKNIPPPPKPNGYGPKSPVIPSSHIPNFSPPHPPYLMGFVVFVWFPKKERKSKYAMGQSPKPVPPVNIRFNPTTKIGSKMGGEFAYPKMVPLVLTHSQLLLCYALFFFRHCFWGSVSHQKKGRKKKTKTPGVSSWLS